MSLYKLFLASALAMANLSPAAAQEKKAGREHKGTETKIISPHKIGVLIINGVEPLPSGKPTQENKNLFIANKLNREKNTDDLEAYFVKNLPEGSLVEKVGDIDNGTTPEKIVAGLEDLAGNVDEIICVVLSHGNRIQVKNPVPGGTVVTMENMYSLSKYDPFSATELYGTIGNALQNNEELKSTPVVFLDPSCNGASAHNASTLLPPKTIFVTYSGANQPTYLNNYSLQLAPLLSHEKNVTARDFALAAVALANATTPDNKLNSPEILLVGDQRCDTLRNLHYAGHEAKILSTHTLGKMLEQEIPPNTLDQELASVTDAIFTDKDRHRILGNYAKITRPSDLVKFPHKEYDELCVLIYAHSMANSKDQESLLTRDVALHLIRSVPTPPAPVRKTAGATLPKP